MSNIAPWLEASLSQVQALKKQNKLSHALLVTGADGVGQEELARAIGKNLMCEQFEQAKACGYCHSCQLMVANTHPDYRVLEGEEGAIKVDQIRQLTQKISQKPQVGRNKVVLITHAQAMNVNAANAVLKALEEPAERTYFVLTSSQSSHLLATIRSRCLLVNVPTPNLNQVTEWLQQQPEGDELSSLFWLTSQPYRLLAIEKQQKTALYTALPSALSAMLLGEQTVDQILKGVNNTTLEDYCNGLAAILHQCINHSAGANLPPALTDIYPLLMRRMSIQQMMLRYQSLQKLKSDLLKTNLNPLMQLTYELNQW
ncbi:DNA polymerase III subunit delta' [Marinomonas pollencensis]|uniref:DNA-directed DNA polymerase n=1 Tax=Marinomonas pollencensis TaxID=491954 RepID=A0A3E0DRK1_9GAMM|nr:DNA polymerase III subunit delta' [Marinomonas pollencensis]REG85741.1 DNA polymerase-3 subunit delta' [Marinomonas pollencensis]